MTVVRSDLQPDWSWTEQAACSEHDTALFYPTDESNAAAYAVARRICGACPVQMDCLNTALALKEKHGVWGGLSPAQRQRTSPGPSPTTRWRRRHAGRMPEGFPHGNAAYVNYGCRCPICRADHAAYNRSVRARRRPA